MKAPKDSPNPFNGKLIVRSIAYPDGPDSWKPDTRYVPGSLTWHFEPTQTIGSNYYGNLELYTEKTPGVSVGFAWMPEISQLYIDHIYESPFGYTDVFNDTFTVRITGETITLFLIRSYEDDDPCRIELTAAVSKR